MAFDLPSHERMTATTYGAILAGLGVFCGVVSFGLDQQAELIDKSKPTTVQQVIKQLETAKLNTESQRKGNQNVVYAHLRGTIDCEPRIISPPSGEESCLCSYVDTDRTDGLRKLTVKCSDNIFLVEHESQAKVRLPNCGKARLQHLMFPLMHMKTQNTQNTVFSKKSNNDSTPKSSNTYYQTETTLKPETPAFIMGHFTKGANGTLELTTKTSIPWWDLRTLWRQPLIIDSSEKERVTSLRTHAKNLHLLSIFLVTLGVGTVIYDNTKFNPN